MITANARQENNPRTPDNTALHPERRQGFKKQEYILYTRDLKLLHYNMEFF
jgi:hypothetical protein